MTGLRRPLRQLFPRRVWNGFAPAAELDWAQFDRDMALPPPETEYVMFFTPRSGSSWVADILTRTRRMGRVTECFNPNFMPRMTRSLNAASLQEYCALLPRRLQTGGVFGFQITLFQMQAVFGRNRAFLDRYADRPWIWLIRSDIVLQAVSLYKMEAARITHAPHLGSADLDRADRALPYDGERILYWLNHVLAMERGTEALIRRAGVQPLRMNYERNATMKSNHIANVIGRHAGRPTMRMKHVQSRHSKLGTDRNADFAERFRSERSELLARIAEERAERVENSLCYGPKGSF